MELKCSACGGTITRERAERVARTTGMSVAESLRRLHMTNCGCRGTVTLANILYRANMLRDNDVWCDVTDDIALRTVTAHDNELWVAARQLVAAGYTDNAHTIIGLVAEEVESMFALNDECYATCSECDCAHGHEMPDGSFFCPTCHDEIGARN